MTETLSIVIPAYNEADNVKSFYQAVQKEKAKIKPSIDVEYWFVDDGSRDKTLAEVKKLRQKNKHVHYVSFSRNFGKEAALFAGLQHATGDYVAVMDADLQDPPSLLPEMIEGVRSGEYDSVGSRRASRTGESKFRSFFARLFYSIVSKISKTYLVDGARDFRVMSRQMVDAVLSLPETQRFSKGIFTWVGFKTTYISYENQEREVGTSSWSFWGLTKYAIEGMISFSTMPLLFVTILGLLATILAVIAAVFVIGRTLIYGTPVSGWPSTITIILAFSGMQLLSLGIVGRYVAAIYNETKRRPIYITKEEA